MVDMQDRKPHWER